MNLFKRLKEFLYPCLNWLEDKKQCRLRYESHQGNFLINLKDLLKDCQGYSNSSLCCWYKNTYFSDNDIKRMREKLRRKYKW